jgi:hypothetical protein
VHFIVQSVILSRDPEQWDQWGQLSNIAALKEQRSLIRKNSQNLFFGGARLGPVVGIPVSEVRRFWCYLPELDGHRSCYSCHRYRRIHLGGWRPIGHAKVVSDKSVTS